MWLGPAECVAHWGLYDPDRLAAVVDGRSITFGVLANASQALSQDLYRLNLAEKRVAIVCGEKAKFLRAVFAAQFAGCSTIICHPSWNPDSLVQVARDTAPVGFLVDDIGAEAVRSVALGRAVLEVASLDGGQFQTTSPLSQPFVGRRREQESEWGIIFSSGSTGAPKPIVQTNYSTMTECVAWCIELGLGKGQSFYIARPLYYTGGLALALATLTTRGLLLVDNYVDDNDESEVSDKIASAALKRDIDRCFLVPDLARAILALKKNWPRRGNPHTVLVMGSKVEVDDKRAIRSLFGCEVVESWGNSEGLGTITDPEDLDRRPASIGRPFLTERLWIVNDSFGELGSDQVGRIVGSDETMFKEYANHPDETGRAKHDELIVSDDIGFRDDNGYFYILGRTDDVVVLAEGIVSMSSLEKEMRAIEGVKDAYVGAVQQDGSLVLAVLIAGSVMVSEETIRERLTKAMESLVAGAPFDASIRVENSIPKLPSGKTDRIKARSLAMELRP